MKNYLKIRKILNGDEFISNNNKQKIRIFTGFICIISILFLLCGFVGTVSAADLVVNNGTTSSDIDSWMKKSSTVKGNNLIFNVARYDLNDTIVVSKSINIKSNKNTLIYFNKNQDMFNITSSQVNFSGLTLQHNGEGTEDRGFSIIYSNSSKTIIVSIKNMSFIVNNNHMGTITIKTWKGNITNTKIIGKGTNYGVVSDKWIGNINKSSFTMEKNSSYSFVILETFTGNVSYTKFILKSSQSCALYFEKNWIGNSFYNNITATGSESIGIFAKKWKGNLLNNKIIVSGSESNGIYAEKWTGKISGSKIYTNGKDSIGIYSNSSTKGAIHKNTIYAKKGFAVTISKNVKVTSSNLISNKGNPKIYVFGPRVDITEVSSYPNSRNYDFRIENNGEYNSKSSDLIITTKGFKKTVKVNSIKAGKYINIKVVLPKKYSTNKILKSARILYLDGYGKKVYSEYMKFKL